MELQESTAEVMITCSTLRAPRVHSHVADVKYVVEEEAKATTMPKTF